jgi:hypothetical protein
MTRAKPGTVVNAGCLGCSVAGRRARRGNAMLIAATLTLPMVALGNRSRGEDDFVGEEALDQQQVQNHLIALDQQMRGMAQQFDMDRVGDRSLARSMFAVGLLDAVCGLDDSQRAKCEAAARLEGRLATAAEGAWRRKYAGRTVDFQSPEGQETWRQFHEDWQAVQRLFQGSGRSKCLVDRLAKTILDARQQAAWREEEERRRRGEWQRWIDRFMETFEPRLGLTGRQHEELVAMLLESPPPLDMAAARETCGEGNAMVCTYALSRLPRPQLEPLFQRHQWEILVPLLRQGADMKQHFESQGLLEE